MLNEILNIDDNAWYRECRGLSGIFRLLSPDLRNDGRLVVTQLSMWGQCCAVSPVWPRARQI